VKEKYFFLVMFFVIGNVSAFSLDINLEKEVYFPGETLQADISVDGTLEEDILTSNVKLLCNNDSVSVAPSLLKLDVDHYYTFFKLSESLTGDCELKLHELIYYEGGFLRQESFYENFSLVETNSSVISFIPAGFRIDDFDLQSNLRVYLTDLNEEVTNISVESSDAFAEVSDSEISWDSLFFDIYLSEFLYDGTPKAEISLGYSGQFFKIPIWIFHDVDDTLPVEENDTYVDEAKIEFVMDVSEFDVSLSENEDLSGYVTVKNTGSDLSEVAFSLTGNLGEVIDLQTENLDEFNSGESFKEYLYVNQRKSTALGVYEGTLKVEYELTSVEFPIMVEITENDPGEVVSNGTGNGGDIDPSDDDEKGISIWWIILVIILLALVAIYLTYRKKTKKKTDFLKGV